MKDSTDYHPPPSTGERYAAATQTSNLRCSADSRGDVDLLIAAGMCKEGLGAALYRLQIEFDAVAQDLSRLPPKASHTDRALVLMRVRSLASAKRELVKHIDTRNLRDMIDERVMFILAAQVLDAFLSPRCSKCTGRGYSGGSHRGEHTELCRPCRGSGQRRDWIGRNAYETRFAQALLATMQREMGMVETQMRRHLPAIRRAKAELFEAVG